MKLRINDPMKYDSSTKPKQMKNKVPAHFLQQTSNQKMNKQAQGGSQRNSGSRQSNDNPYDKSEAIKQDVDDEFEVI